MLLQTQNLKRDTFLFLKEKGILKYLVKIILNGKVEENAIVVDIL